jgi:hypothetical protein
MVSHDSKPRRERKNYGLLNVASGTTLRLASAAPVFLQRRTVDMAHTPKGFTYKSYSFIDKDPIIDEIRTVYQDSGANYQWIQEHSSVRATTLAKWFSGVTKRPQAATINAVLRSLGYKLGVVAFTDVVRIEPAMPQPKPRPTPRPTARHIVQMAKYKRAR